MMTSYGIPCDRPYPAPPNDKFGGKCLDSWTIPDGAEANASAPALAKRAGVNHADELAPPFPDDHPVQMTY